VPQRRLLIVLAVLLLSAPSCRTGTYDTSGRPWPTTSEVPTKSENTASTTASLDLAEFSINGELQVPAGPVVLTLRNNGVIEHNVRLVGGPVSETLPANSTSQFDVGELAAGTYELICELPGHQDAGMIATLTVVR